MQRTFNCTVTRVRRSGIDLPPEPELLLKFGDKLMVAGEKEDIKELGQVFGNDEKKLSDTDFFPIAAGIVPWGIVREAEHFVFGFLLFLARADWWHPDCRTYPERNRQDGTDHLVYVRFRQPVASPDRPTSVPRRGRNIRRSQPGINIPGKRLDTVRNRYGDHNGTDDRAVLFGYFVFKIHILDLIGTIAGGMTSTPGLAAADSMSDSSAPSIAYATVYPIAMVFLILFIQFIAALIA